ncbi:sulfotransferase family protein [Aestuariicella sp. G3-2]|uniref:sulfotransferase family 2 domain-containing protein n=1 Tax=Pseudomaricurvus albidus TaxID=2842452 RepID=UPI001C0CD404|nr:sulfotransferase family 2 domain-containing protein [Aestuariicella albida]MBU3071532.1 sulfotransferase family protein [Aestuariicella albida]
MNLRDVKRAARSVVPESIATRYDNHVVSRRLNTFEKSEAFSDGYSLMPFRNYKSIFIHVPKAAGISVAHALFGCRGGGHATYRDYYRHFGKEMSDFFVFSIVRSPVDRAFSAYTFLRSGGISDFDRVMQKEVFSRFDSFSEFVIEYLNDDTCRKLLHFKPQVDFLKNSKGVLDIDFIGKFENIDKDFSYISERVIGRGGSLVALNATKGKPKELNLDSGVVDKLNKIYVEDFEALGY